MRYEVLEQFFGQIVDVTLVSRGTMSGTLGPSEMDDGCQELVDLEPASLSSQKRFGPWVLCVDAIVGVRLIKPHVEDDDDDCKAECDEAV